MPDAGGVPVPPSSPGRARILHGGIARSPCDARPAGAILCQPHGAGDAREATEPPASRPRRPRHDRPRNGDAIVRSVGERPRSRFPTRSRDPARRSIDDPIERQVPIDRMDAKQVWRAALGELQVSLSPANFETWLRETQLVDVDDQRFLIGPERVRQGLARDPLPVADQPDPRPHRRLQRPGRVRGRRRADRRPGSRR